MKKISMRGTNYYLTSFNCMYLLSYLSNIFKKRENCPRAELVNRK